MPKRRLPVPDSDIGSWGNILNDYLRQLCDIGSGAAVNGGTNLKGGLNYWTTSTRPTQAYSYTKTGGSGFETLGLDHEGLTGLNTDTGQLERWNGSSWATLSTAYQVGNLKLTGNTFSAENTNGDLLLTANGTGTVKTGNLSFSANSITATNVNGDVTLTPNGTGTVKAGNLALSGNTLLATNVNGDLLLTANGTGTVKTGNLSFSANTISTTNTNGNLNLTPNGTGLIDAQKVVQFTGGSSTNPGITIVADNDTGIFSPAADSLAITTAANERLRINASGNVGIGTTAPNSRLDVGQITTTNATSTATQVSSGALSLTGSFWNGTAETKSRFTLQNSASTTSNGFGRLVFGWNSSELVVVTAGGSVGIGNAINGSPSYRFQVREQGTNATLPTPAGNFTMFANSTANGIHYYKGSESMVYPKINAGITNSGYIIGAHSQAFRNSQVAGDSGTLSELVGHLIQYGHYNFDASTPTTSSIYGLKIEPYTITGSVNNMYDIFISPNGDQGSAITNRWAIFQNDTNSRNYLGGKLGIGNSAPSAQLHVRKEDYVNIGNTQSHFYSEASLSLNAATSDLFINNRVSTMVKVVTGVNSSANVYGTRSGIVRNNSGVTNDNGTLARMFGSLLEFGHTNAGTSTPITTDVYGLQTVFYNNSGTVTNLFHLHIGTQVYTTGTTTNQWGLYQIGGSLNNYFEGKLGIGTGGNTPTSALHIRGVGQASATPSTTATQGASIIIQDTGTNVNNGGMLLFGMNQGQFAGIKGLATDGSSNTQGSLAFFTRNTTTDATLTQRMIIIPTGQVGIGRTPSVNAFEVNGDASKTTAGSWLANSDRRIKTEILPVENALLTINKLNPVKFKYTPEYKKDKPIEDKFYYNYIAQEFKEVFPDSVKGSGEFLTESKKPEEEILQVDTYNAQIYLVKAVQELHQLVKDQQNLISDLQAQINELKG